MTYDPNNGSGAFHCDTCPESIETEEDNFKSAFRVAHGKGWRAYVGPDQKWAHACPACAYDFAKEKR